jgi:hypothetical protein
MCHTPNYGRKWTWVWFSCCRQPLEGGRVLIIIIVIMKDKAWE